MGIFDRWTGNKGKDLKPSAQKYEEPKKEVIPVKPGHLPSEVILSARSISEANEKVRTVSFSVLRYGKTLEHAGGPIVGGNEHHPSGMSDDFPKELLSLITDNAEGSAGRIINDAANYQQNGYFWRDEQGAVIRIATNIKGVPYIICALLGKRSEGGDNDTKLTRNYHERTYVAIPASEWSVAIIPQLKDIIKLQPHLKGEDKTLKHIDANTAILDRPLPQDWLDEDVKGLAARIISGWPVGIYDTQITEREFLNRLYYVLLCLPESVAREISFGTGLGKTKGDIRVGHGLQISTKTYQNRGQAGVPGKWEGDDAEGLRIGQEYINELMPRLSAAKTAREVIGIVSMLPTMTIAKVKNSIFPDGR